MLGLLVMTLWCAVATTAVRESQPQILPEPGLCESACHGTAYKYVDFQFHCTRPESVIAVSSVKAAAKPSSKNCSTVLSSGIDDRYYNRCCTVDPDTDCSVAYRNINESVTYEIQSVCNGHHKCPSPVRVPPMPVRGKCEHTVFPENSNYMTVDYFCIKKSKIAVLWSGSKRLEGGQSVYLQSPGYPCNYTNSNAEEWCKINVSDTTIPIQVMSIDVQLAETARIVFKDAQSCKDSNIITYQNNSKYQLRNIFNLTNNVLLSYKHGAFSSGRFWIGFVSNQNLSISCGITIDENCTTRYLLNSTSLTIKHNNTCSDGKITDKFYTLGSTTEKNINNDHTISSSATSTSTNAMHHITRSSTDGTRSSPSTGPDKYHTTRPHTKGKTTTNRINTESSKDSAPTIGNNQTLSISVAEFQTKGFSPDSTTIITGSNLKKDSPKNSDSTTTSTRSPTDRTLNSPSTGPEKYHTTRPHTKGTTTTDRINTKSSKDSAPTIGHNQTLSISVAEFQTKGFSLDSTTPITGSNLKKDSPKNSDGTTATKTYNVSDSSTYSNTVTYKNYTTSSPIDSNTTIHGFHTTIGFRISGTAEKYHATASPMKNSTNFGSWWIALIFAFIITFIVIAVFAYRIQKRKRKVSDMNVEQELSPEDAFSVTPDERNLIAPCKTTIDIFIPERRNNALPKIGEGDIAEKETTSKKGDRKKKRKKKKKSKQREENEVYQRRKTLDQPEQRIF